MFCQNYTLSLPLGGKKHSHCVTFISQCTAEDIAEATEFGG